MPFEEKHLRYTDTTIYTYIRHLILPGDPLHSLDRRDTVSPTDILPAVEDESFDHFSSPIFFKTMP